MLLVEVRLDLFGSFVLFRFDEKPKVPTPLRGSSALALSQDTDDNTYFTGFVTRKFLILEFAIEESLRQMKWETVSLEMLRTISPDQIGALNGLPVDWNAAHLSLFLFGRSDWALFATCFPCLYHEVSQKYMAHNSKMLMNLVASTRWTDAAKNFVSVHHRVGHPTLIINQLQLSFDDEGTKKDAAKKSKGGKVKKP